MSTDWKEELIKAIGECSAIPDIIWSMPFGSLARDLEKAQETGKKNLRLSYADLGTFQLEMQRMRGELKDAALPPEDKESGRKSLDALLHTFDGALHAGVFVTQDTALTRVGSVSPRV